MNSHRKQYPVKTSVNLLRRDRTNALSVRVLLSAAVFVVVLTVFSKFAVIDRLSAAAKAQREARELEGNVDQLKRANSDFEEVLREYQHYYFSAAEGSETYVDCMDVLGLLETELLHRAEIQTANLTGNVLTVNLTEINLEEASVIARSLEQHMMVQDVTVSFANRQQSSEGTTVYLNIILETGKGGTAEEDAGPEEEE